MSGAGLGIRLRAPLADFELACDLALESPCVGLFGASGAGKTSILEMLAGWRKPRSGRVRVGERVLFDSELGVDLPPRERGIGYVPQDVLLFPHRSVLGNATAARRRGRAPDPAHVERVLEVLEIAPLAARDVAHLSGGERQRVALARALCSDPDLLLLDEPLGALDVPLRRRILPYLIRVRESFEVPLVLVSHDATEVQALCDHVVVLERGSVSAEGAPAAVLGGARVGGMGFENVLRGTVRELGPATASLELAPDLVVRVPLRGVERGRPAVFGLRADEVLIATEPPRGLSARNVLDARVVDLHREGQDVLLAAALEGRDGSGPLVRVSLTTEAVSELALRPGGAVHLVFKAQSCHLLA